MATRAKVKIDEAIIDTFTVAATKTATLGKRVKFASADNEIQDCVAGEDGIGVALSSAAAGAKVGVLLDGHAMVKVLVGTGGATRGKPAIPVTDGLTDMLSSSSKASVQYPAGKFMQSGVVGDYVGLLVGGTTGGNAPNADSHFRVRNILNGNVANLAAYTVAAGASTNDNVLGVEGDLVAAVAQTTASENAIYRLGAVSGGACAMTRVAELPAGAAFLKGSISFDVAEGDVYVGSFWKNTAAGTLATDDPAFFPRFLCVPATLVAGKIAITSIPILSATKSQFGFSRRTANTCSLSVGGYHQLNVTPGKLGTATFEATACIDAGTINVNDISSLNVSVTNQL